MKEKLNQQLAIDCRKCSGWNVRLIAKETLKDGIKYLGKCKDCGNQVTLFIPIG